MRRAQLPSATAPNTANVAPRYYTSLLIGSNTVCQHFILPRLQRALKNARHQPRPAHCVHAYTLAANPPCSQYRPMTRMSMGQLITIIQALEQHGHQPSEAWLREYAAQTGDRLGNLQPAQLAAILRGFVGFNFHPGEDWLHAFDVACYCNHRPFDPQSATEVLESMVQIPFTNFRFPEAVYLKVLAEAHTFTFQQLRSILHSLTLLPVGIMDKDLFDDVVGHHMAVAMARMDSADLQHNVLNQICYGGSSSNWQ